LVKIKIILVFLASLILFGAVGWSMVKPIDPTETLTLVLHQQPIRSVLATLLLGGAAVALAVVIGGRQAHFIGPAALPIGMSVWAVLTNRIDGILLNHRELVEGKNIFYYLLADMVLWFLILYGGMWAVRIISRKLLSRKSISTPSGPEIIEPSVARLAQNKSDGPQKQQKEYLIHTQGVILVVVIAFILLRIIIQSGTADVVLSNQKIVKSATIPAQGQIVCGVLLSFWLATWVTRKLFKVPLNLLILAPFFVGVIFYLYAAFHGSRGTFEPFVDLSSPFILSSFTAAAILPVQYIGLGTLAVIAAYWYSFPTTDTNDFI